MYPTCAGEWSEESKIRRNETYALALIYLYTVPAHNERAEWENRRYHLCTTQARERGNDAGKGLIDVVVSSPLSRARRLEE